MEPKSSIDNYDELLKPNDLDRCALCLEPMNILDFLPIDKFLDFLLDGIKASPSESRDRKFLAEIRGNALNVSFPRETEEYKTFHDHKKEIFTNLHPYCYFQLMDSKSEMSSSWKQTFKMLNQYWKKEFPQLLKLVRLALEGYVLKRYPNIKYNWLEYS